MKQTAEVIAKLGIKREAGYLYFLDKQGNLARVPMSRKGRHKGAMNK